MVPLGRQSSCRTPLSTSDFGDADFGEGALGVGPYGAERGLSFFGDPTKRWVSFRCPLKTPQKRRNPQNKTDLDNRNGVVRYFQF